MSLAPIRRCGDGGVQVKAILVGSPTVNRRLLSSIRISNKRGLGFKNKKAAAFGTYGWSGEGNKIITEILEDAGFAIVNEGIKELWMPHDTALENSIRFGREFVRQL